MQELTITTASGFDIRVDRSVIKGTSEIRLRIDGQRGCLIHWGLRRDTFSPWLVPTRTEWPELSEPFDSSAVRTRFAPKDGGGEILFRLAPSQDFFLLEFALFFPEEGRWDNNRGRNYRIDLPLMEISMPRLPSSGIVTDLSKEIIDREMSRNSWTLMHRFDLCFELLDRVKPNDIDGMSLIFVWLRYSAIRQLDWQRNYNTKPRELGHAVDRLTLKLADRYAMAGEEREMIRLIMATLGRGSNAQKVRDEVLNIMHRHNIKEVSGHFMEEWHQKLHNNTTPDDIVICEAYLEFLRSNGNLQRFYRRLEEGGVSRERLEGFERPIRSGPDFVPHLKDALIHDFENFLGILKEVHSGADLGIAISAARRLLDGELKSAMDYIWSHHQDKDADVLLRKITQSRHELAGRLAAPSRDLRDILFLDIALEDLLRIVVERGLGPELPPEQLVYRIGIVLENLCVFSSEVELQYTLRHWRRLENAVHFVREWSLSAESVLERLRRAIASFIDHYHNLIQPKAEFLGEAFHAAQWTIRLFSEEVIRGRPVFVLSALLRGLGPLLRKSADLGNWLVISRGHGAGELISVDALRSVQGKAFEQPVVISAQKISGDEEIPPGVVGIVTPSDIDALSHLAIRARNSGVLFAVCYDDGTIARLKSLEGRLIRVGADSRGIVSFDATDKSEVVFQKQPVASGSALSEAVFSDSPISMADFSERNVGYKSNELRRLRGRLPAWIDIPPSVALPFGIFERSLSARENSETASRYSELVRRMKEVEGDQKTVVLSDLRDTILGLRAPEHMDSALRRVMEQEGLQWPADWENAWSCVKKVWASKWNERACLSREANGIPHDSLIMSVLIQKVVESEYSFVIHTVNPLTNKKEEVYTEVVLGLGETLAANYPGRALSFVFRKGSTDMQLLSFPSKSTGIYGGGLIFRSDSNGEDLSGYAGAGLYDSFVFPPSSKVILDYSGEPLVWDEGFRKETLLSIGEIGDVVEKVMGSPQDIEGAYSKGRCFVVQTRPQVGMGNT